MIFGIIKGLGKNVSSVKGSNYCVQGIPPFNISKAILGEVNYSVSVLCFDTLVP
jgi:hypothetical protein